MPLKQADIDEASKPLRAAKKNWNKAYKEFSQRLKNFKDALNGRGSSKYGLPPSNLKNPLPPELASFLSELTSNYTALSDAAHHIMQQQEEYSHTRRQPAKVATAAAKKGKVNIGGHIFDTELALTTYEQEKGLMNERAPKVMSFIYSAPTINKFWMKNTPNELDIVFSCNGQIINICRGEPFSTRLIGDDRPSDFIVELPAGTIQSKGIKIGDPIQLL